MSDIKIDIQENITLKFDELPTKIRNEFKNSMLKQMLKLSAFIKKSKLSGQVLHARTGNLRRSINARTYDQGNDIIGSVGTNVKYAAIHEYGGDINHPGGTAYYIDKKTGLAVFVSNKSSMAEHLKRTRPHKISIRERSFLRSALKEKTDDITKGLSDSIVEVINE